jgi:CRP-like cAMP-binding protein
LREKSFAKGELLFFEGNQCQRIFIVRSGRVKLFRSSASGREQTLMTLETSDTCCCNPGTANWTCTSSAEALVPTTVWYLSVPNYVRILTTYPKVRQAINELFADRLRNFSALIEEVSLKDAKKRLVRFLLDMLDQNQNKSDLYVPFTREELAQRLGTARETVARHLSQLVQDGLIETKPKHVIVRNKQKLESLLK